MRGRVTLHSSSLNSGICRPPARRGCRYETRRHGQIFALSTRDNRVLAALIRACRLVAAGTYTGGAPPSGVRSGPCRETGRSMSPTATRAALTLLLGPEGRPARPAPLSGRRISERSPLRPENLSENLERDLSGRRICRGGGWRSRLKMSSDRHPLDVYRQVGGAGS